MRNVQKSVTSTIVKAMLLILLLSVITTGFAIFTLASSLNDAEAVNVAGSMRMQSYRLANDIQTQSEEYRQHINQFERSLYSSSMKSLQHWSVPSDITQDYYQLIRRWHELKSVLNSQNKSEYLALVAKFVGNIDHFVFKLQRYSEQKLIMLAWVGGVGLGGVLLVSFFVVHFIRREIVRPLRDLVVASEQIQNRIFTVSLNEGSRTEMGILTRTFNSMAGELGKLYLGLEQAVNEKTLELQNANQSLQVLYQSSQELTASRISQDNFASILRYIVTIDEIEAVKLEIDEEEGMPLILEQGEWGNKNAHSRELKLDSEKLGLLTWVCRQECPDKALMDNFVQILSRSIYYNRAQKQAEQLLLMEERSTIARELHDSLAQSLSYLKIQVSLLKRVMKKLQQEEQQERARSILTDIDQALSQAYTQLRELLTTFRLSIKEGTFGQALAEMLNQLGEQTEAKITLDNRLSSIHLDAHQQVHLMQLIREATLNAMKHARARNIHIACEESGEQVTVIIEDDGIGFDQQELKHDHYGMSIMQERAARLNGELTVNSSPTQGCRIILTYKRTKDTEFDQV